MKLGVFCKNEQYGKGRDQLSREIREVTAETRKRKVNGNDTEDQECREGYLREARSRLN
ncbi:MAG TPA: hypothetical protein VHX38_13620 [Pseudonocardiaceae bacterium]|jgi:hypothetical protein|nr:hypothetical protein [Pseudonocardiaceae bacterium]